MSITDWMKECGKTRRNKKRHIEKVLTNSDMSLNLLRSLISVD
jgi:hypothetical protein